MDERDKAMQNLLREIGKWKNRALEAAQMACANCEDREENYACNKCRIRIIKESAAR